MAKRCDHCGKGTLRGSKIARARQGLNYRSPRIFKPNLHSFKLRVGTRKKKLTLCTKCLRRVKAKQAELRKKEEGLRLAKEAGKVKKKRVKKEKKVEKKKRPSRKEARKKRVKEKKEKEART